MMGSYLGPCFRNDEIEEFLRDKNIPFVKLEKEEMSERVAELVAQEKVIGWFQGRMEFGPRALGARSIIGDARSPKMQEKMNLKIKFRESFRPFAPSVLREKVTDYFEIECDSPYMLLVAPVKEKIRCEVADTDSSFKGVDLLNVVRSKIPAVTHIDYSARVQTVCKDQQPSFYNLLRELDKKYESPVIINTSFNVRGEPIVCTPDDAYRCFMRTNMDYLVIENCLIEKKVQKPLGKDINWLREFELD